MNKSQNNKRIAKNTLLLYFRMIVMTIVSIYTTRITLQILGVEDFGIRNVIAGIISFMGIVTTAMVNAAQRFLAYGLGTNDMVQFRRTFSMLINLFIIISVIGIVLFELVGPYFISHQLTIPPNRLNAAQWIFQFTILDFVISTLVIPYTSAVIAYEKMDIFAYVSLLDAGLKLAVVYLLYITPYDHLITIVFMTVVAHLLSNLVYVVYCKVKLAGCIYQRYWDQSVLKHLLSFMGWNLFGTATSVMNVQGQAILLNIFFGPVVNAAKAISDNVHTLVISFVSNFFMAVNPQIVKTYANNEKEYTKQLVLKSSRFSLFLILLLSMPLIVNMKPMLVLWLGEGQVTDDMVLFSQWTLIHCMALSFEYPITQTVRATGEIKKYQIGVGVQTLMFIPICYLVFKLGAPPIASMILLTAICMIVLFYRVWSLSKILDITIGSYYRRIVIPFLFVAAISAICLHFTHIEPHSFIMLLVSCLMVAIETVLVIILLGLNKEEWIWMRNYVGAKCRKSGSRNSHSSNNISMMI